MRVAYFVHGRGRGHAVRARVAVPRLRAAGHDVHVLASGQALELLADVETPRAVAPCVPGPGMARAWRERLRHDLGALRALRPDVLVSDADGPSMHAAWLLGLPRLAVGHGLLFRHATLPPSIPRLPRLRETINAASSSWPADRRVVVHFAPVAPRTPGTVIARPDLRDDLARTHDEGFVLAYFRDGDGARWLHALARRGRPVVCFTTGTVPAGVERRAPDARAFADALARCHAVVGSAGNHLPAECAMLGVPMLALHRADDVEQRMNATLVARAGLGLAASMDADVDLHLDALDAFVPDPEVASRVRAMPTASEAIAHEVAHAHRLAARASSPRARGASSFLRSSRSSRSLRSSGAARAPE
jgi:UDP-N-acetylglucosamine--N-acetylmuramyl-(pentapeptide) pyrophosphoryl-undecaprenol N-acetylglucosamine transferase